MIIHFSNIFSDFGLVNWLPTKKSIYLAQIDKYRKMQRDHTVNLQRDHYSKDVKRSIQKRCKEINTEKVQRE